MTSITCTRVDPKADLYLLPVGSFCFRVREKTDSHRGYELLCINTPGGIAQLNVSNPEVSPCWEFNGDRDKPTVSPSILIWHEVEQDDGTRKRVEDFHGWLKDGLLSAC